MPFIKYLLLARPDLGKNVQSMNVSSQIGLVRGHGGPDEKGQVCVQRSRSVKTMEHRRGS